jgi:hypothetical protein
MGQFIRHSVVAGLTALAVAVSAPWQTRFPVTDAPGVLSPDEGRGSVPGVSKGVPRGRSRILAHQHSPEPFGSGSQGGAPSVEASQPPEARNNLRPNGRTAIYDIAAHAVYLPNGDTLEAHSGLGSNLDDPRYASLKNRGPTPPNDYTLTLRDQPFHGVRAIRLIPLDESKMFGRDGMLAHSYLRGPTGQSSGCVSFRDYTAFLNAFLRGEVDRLVVVDHLADESS